MRIAGTISKVLNPVTGTKADGGQWVKQEFIITLDGGGNYPDVMVITAFGDRVNDVQRLAIGQHVTALIDLKCREYNGRHFTNINLYKF